MRVKLADKHESAFTVCPLCNLNSLSVSRWRQVTRVTETVPLNLHRHLSCSQCQDLWRFLSIPDCFAQELPPSHPNPKVIMSSLLGKSTLVPSCLLLFQPYYAKQNQSIICDNLELQRQAWNPNQLISTAANLWFRIHPPPPPCYGDILFGNITTNPSMISTKDAVDPSLKVSLMTSSVLVCSLLDSTTMPSRDFFCFADCSCSSH